MSPFPFLWIKVKVVVLLGVIIQTVDVTVMLPFRYLIYVLPFCDGFFCNCFCLCFICRKGCVVTFFFFFFSSMAELKLALF